MAADRLASVASATREGGRVIKRGYAVTANGQEEEWMGYGEPCACGAAVGEDRSVSQR